MPWTRMRGRYVDKLAWLYEAIRHARDSTGLLGCGDNDWAENFAAEGRGVSINMSLLRCFSTGAEAMVGDEWEAVEF